MNQKLNELLAQANQIYPGTIMTRVGTEKDGQLRVDRVEQSVLADRLLIEVPDQTEADFVLGNELLKLLLSLNGIVPQIYFALTFEKEELDQQLISIATRMHRVVVHAIAYRELAKQGLLTADTAQAYLAGVRDELSDEGAELDGEFLWRLLTLMDAQIFLATMRDYNLSDQATTMKKQLDQLYPQANQAATDLVEPVLTANLKDSRQIRKQMVRLFAGVDKALESRDLPTVNATQYVTLTPVLSQRQLDGPVSNFYEIFHSEMVDFQTHEKAYVGLGKQDQQNTFVVTPPSDEAERPKFFTELYQTSVKELLTKLALPYILRQ
ncbi:hypothetical protein [Fructobacillus ficulneus]|uniref:Nitrate ABC transporter ATPase n=1 Tax=Fructobacillus ficulneus TaxID=157463 RepID=A0A0K8MGC5_9LACO|nr:hypothetical protein [Fructobacillus ficulneus]GAO99253.1 nitrate ABC transporter ATPase [Fructobacillus ficulneus]